MELISPNQEPGQRTQRRFWLALGCLVEDTPPHQHGPGGEPDGEDTTHHPDTSHHLSLPAHLDQMATAFHQSRTI